MFPIRDDFITRTLTLTRAPDWGIRGKTELLIAPIREELQYSKFKAAGLKKSLLSVDCIYARVRKIIEIVLTVISHKPSPDGTQSHILWKSSSQLRQFRAT